MARGGGRDESGEITDDEAHSPGEDGDYVLSESDDDAPLVRKFIVDHQPESPHTKRVQQ